MPWGGKPIDQGVGVLPLADWGLWGGLTVWVSLKSKWKWGSFLLPAVHDQKSGTVRLYNLFVVISVCGWLLFHYEGSRSPRFRKHLQWHSDPIPLGGWRTLSHYRDSSRFSAISFKLWLDSQSWAHQIFWVTPGKDRAHLHQAPLILALGLPPPSWLYPAPPPAITSHNTRCKDLAVRWVSSERQVPGMGERDGWGPRSSWWKDRPLQPAVGWGFCRPSAILGHPSTDCKDDW